jgi:hypothetical protein
MSETVEFARRAVLIGGGATMVMDLWAALLRPLGVPLLNLAFLGRWIGHLARGHWMHVSIATETPVRGELWIGWCAHYSIGVTFSALLLWTYGLEWARSPSVLPALFIGIVTAVAPLLILQPAMGAGIASWKTPRPVFNSIKSLATHSLWPWYVPRRARSRLAPALRQMTSGAPRDAPRGRRNVDVNVSVSSGVAPKGAWIAPSHRDDDLPSCMSVLDVADCGGHLVERESAVDHRSHLSSFAEFLQHQQVSLAGLH